MTLALTSDTLSQGQLYDLASTIVAQKLSQVDGVGEVTVGGSSLPAVRVTVLPGALANRGVSLDDVRTALANANANRPRACWRTTAITGRSWSTTSSAAPSNTSR